MSRLLTLALTTLSLSLFAPPIVAQQDSTPQNNQTNNQKVDANQGKEGLSIDAGYVANLRSGSRDQFYYNVVYRGKTLAQKAKSLSDSIFFDPITAPAQPDPGGDTNAFSLRLEKDTVTTGGPLFNGLGIQKLPFLRSRFLNDLRGAVQVTGKLDSKKLDVAIGLETRPYHPLESLNKTAHLGITNWVVIGAQQGTQSKDTSAMSNSSDVSLLTYRSFFGTGFHYVYSDEILQAKKIVAAGFAKSASTYLLMRSNRLNNKLVDDTVDTKLAAGLRKRLDAAYRNIENNAAGFAKDRATTTPDPSTSTDSDINYRLFLDELKSASDPPATPADAPHKALAKLVREFLDASTHPGATRSREKDLKDAREAIQKYWQDGMYTADTVQKTRLFLDLILSLGLFRVDEPRAVDKTIKDLLGATPPPSDGDAATLTKMQQIGDLKEISELPGGNSKEEKLFEQKYANRLLIEFAFPKSDIQSIEDPKEWKVKYDAFLGDFTAIQDRPTIVLWVTDTGWYRFAGNFGGPSFNNLLAVDMTYYLNPAAMNRQWVRLSYQNGRDRSAPTDYRHFINLSVGFEF